MKHYARQINPEHQESPLYLFDEWPEDLAVYGNDRLRDHLPDIVETLFNNWEDAADDVEQVIDGSAYACYDTVTEAIMDYLPPVHKKKYSSKDVHEWKRILASLQKCSRGEEERYFCQALQLMTGKEWDYTKIRGCCQGDWQNVIYQAKNWSEEALEAFEAEYFNTGSEWMVHDEETEPECPESINGYCVYCTAWNDDGIRQQLTDAIGCSPEDVVMYTHNGSYSVDTYKLVSA